MNQAQRQRKALEAINTRIAQADVWGDKLRASYLRMAVNILYFRFFGHSRHDESMALARETWVEERQQDVRAWRRVNAWREQVRTSQERQKTQ